MKWQIKTVGVLLVALVASSCSSQKLSRPPRSPKPPEPFQQCAPAAFTGSGYLVMGSSDLYQFDFCPLRLRKTEMSKVLEVAARGELALAVSEEQLASRDSGHAFETDQRIRFVKPEGLVRPASLPDDIGRNLAVSPQGLVSYTTDTTAQGSQSWELRKWNPANGSQETLLRDPSGLGATSWSSDGDLVVVAAEFSFGDNEPNLIVFDKDGSAREIPLWLGRSFGGVNDIRAVVAGPRDKVAVLQRGWETDDRTGRVTDKKTLIVDTRTRDEIKTRWTALAWAPDGKKLLVEVEDRGLGLVDAGDWHEVHPLGPLDGTVTSAAWAKP